MNKSKLLLRLMLLATPFSVSTATAAGWCTLLAGDYAVVSHGAKSDNVWIYGHFEGLTTNVWIPIANSTYGQSSVSIALAGQLAAKNVRVYLDGADDTCETYVSWSGVARHVQIVD